MVAPLAQKRKHLESKGATRKHKAIAGRLPAGTADLKSVPKGKDYVLSVKGHNDCGVEAYCSAVRGATETFKESHRATTTAAGARAATAMAAHVAAHGPHVLRWHRQLATHSPRVARWFERAACAERQR